MTMDKFGPIIPPTALRCYYALGYGELEDGDAEGRDMVRVRCSGEMKNSWRKDMGSF
jgi:hypothetical protein